MRISGNPPSSLRRRFRIPVSPPAKLEWSIFDCRESLERRGGVDLRIAGSPADEGRGCFGIAGNRAGGLGVGLGLPAFGGRAAQRVHVAMICGRIGTNTVGSVTRSTSTRANPALLSCVSVSRCVWQPSKNQRHGRKTRRWIFPTNVVSGAATCSMQRNLGRVADHGHVRHEPVAELRYGLDAAPVVVDGLAGEADRAMDRALADHRIRPERIEELLLRHHAVAVTHEVFEHRVGLRLEGPRGPGAP